MADESTRGGVDFAYDMDATEPASEAVVTAVSAVVGREPAALPPLYASIDPDALDVIVDGGESVRITFEYAGFTVEIVGKGLYLRAEDS